MNKEQISYAIYKGKRIGQIKCQDLETMIYFLNVEDLIIDKETLRKTIPTDRYEKMIKYRRQEDKQLLAGNELLFEFGMKRIKPELKYEDIQREVDEAGKPYIKNIDDVFFNMSHSGTYAVCAFSNKRIGVDVECVEQLDLSIAESFFREGEYKDIISMETKEKQFSRFYDYWVLKESFMKSIGLGLSIELNSFWFDKISSRLLKVVQEIDQRNYICRQLYFGNDYKMAICREAG